MSQPVIGFAGLTHLGINSAVASAARGFQVIGYDTNSALVAGLKRGVLPVEEPQLPELLAAHAGLLKFDSFPRCLAACDIVYVSIDVPTDDHGVSDLAPIHKMIHAVTANMHANALLVILCQVPPGFTRLITWPTGQLYYQVETLIFGRAIDRALFPERIILGCSRPEQRIDDKLLNYIQSFDCPILPMHFESAELAKISINMFLVASVTTANTLAELCEQVGADWAEIVPALRYDKRIGPHAYLNPGLGIAGGNLERDLATVLRYARDYNTDGTVVAAWVANSRHCKDWAWRTLTALVPSQLHNLKIAMLGLTYKADTNSTKNSAALALLKHLGECMVNAFDPLAATTTTGPGVRRTQTAFAAIEGADVLVIMTPWPEFRKLTSADLATLMVGRVVIDPYRMLDAATLRAAGFSYATLGAQVSIVRPQ